MSPRTGAVQAFCMNKRIRINLRLGIAVAPASPGKIPAATF
jgi:hypothetical protein